jgi:hypothetical protein
MTAHQTDYERLQADAFEYSRYPELAAANIKLIVNKLFGGMRWGGTFEFSKVSQARGTRLISNGEFTVDAEGEVTGSVKLSFTYKDKRPDAGDITVDIKVPVSIVFSEELGVWALKVFGAEKSFSASSSRPEAISLKNDSELDGLQNDVASRIRSHIRKRVIVGQVKHEDTQ